jgi:hypothetical protein
MVLARGGDARKTDVLSANPGIDAKPQAPHQLVFGHFHVLEKGRKVHDPRHVGIMKLDHAGSAKRRAHILIADFRLQTSD